MLKVFEVNAIGIIRTVQNILPSMIKNKKGHIVTIASMGGLSGINKGIDYCASKFGAVGIDESLRYELQKAGHHNYIKTTCINPYFINGQMFKGVKEAWPFYLLEPAEVA